jgi:hypothetical protein
MQLGQAPGVHQRVGSTDQEHGYTGLLRDPASAGDDLARCSIAAHGVDCYRECSEGLTGWPLAAASH